MIRVVLASLLLAACVHEAPPAGASQPPSLAYPHLFRAVAEARLYEPKDWADHVPRREAAAIEADYLAARPEGEALRAFVEANFDAPAEIRPQIDLDPARTLAEHVDALWPVLTRPPQEAASGSLLPLPSPYLVPGGRFRELYYWDAYFTLLGLPDDQTSVKRGMAANFAAQVEAYGHVLNGNRTYYLSRSQPPFLYLLIGLLDEEDPAAAWAEHLEVLRAEHAFWTTERAVTLPTGEALSRYDDARDVPRDESYVYDVETAAATDRPAPHVYRDLRAGAESGWDYSSRWLADGATLATIETTSVVPVDLNALLYGLEDAIAAACVRLADQDCAETYALRAAERRDAIGDVMWHEDGYFADLDAGDAARRPRVTAATLYPLFTGVATQDQADAVAATVRDVLLASGGVLPTPERTGQQWDAPNGWAPHQWIAVHGLRAYGHHDLADEVARRWTSLVAFSFCRSGKLTEKYDVVDAAEGGGGEYPNQDGFGWTNGVTMRLVAADERLAGLADVPVLGDAEACREVVDAALR